MVFAQVAAQAPTSESHSASTSGSFHFPSAGFSGVVNTPTARVLDAGTVSVGVQNSNPEYRNPYPGIGFFGSFYTGMGILPGLETYLRLSNTGDLHCNQFEPGCLSLSRDLSLNAKYQLPWRFPWHSTIAIGVTDFGGAATHYNGHYGVWSVPIGPGLISLGHAQKKSTQTLLDGTFGSVVMPLAGGLSVMAEHDTRGARAGLGYARALSRDWSVKASWSRHLGSQPYQQSNQLNVGLFIDLGASTKGKPSVSAHQPRDGTHWASPVPIAAPTVSPSPTAAPAKASDPLPKVVYWESESLQSRKSKLQALGQMLGAWLEQQPNPEQTGVFSVTYLGQPTWIVKVKAKCAKAFAQGADTCDGLPVFEPQQGTPDMREQSWESPAQDGFATSRGKPQLELGVALRKRVGTELGLFDHSFAAELGLELPLARGLSYQGVWTHAVSHSDDFRTGGIFARDAYRGTQMQQSLLTYWQPVILPWPGQYAAQVAAGKINASDAGGQVEAVWLSPQGRWRWGALAGQFEGKSPLYPLTTKTPQLLSGRYSLLPGQWQLELTAGRFYQNDQGFRAASYHWFGNNLIQLYYRNTAMREGVDLSSRKFAGFEISFPFGDNLSLRSDVGTLRGRDRFGIGLETMVQNPINLVVGGYGVVARPRHGLASDVTDFDRLGWADVWANRDMIRQAMKTK